MFGCSPKVNVVVLPEEGGKVGAVEYVGVDGQKQVLDKAYEAIAIDKSGESKKANLDAATVAQKYGSLLSAMPNPPKSFMIFFGSESASLDGKDLSVIDEAVSYIKSQKAVEVVCAGHTDGLGQKSYNRELSLKRAKAVSELLSKKGVDERLIVVRHYGCANPLEKVEKGKSSPKNRRVEMIVR